jgi:hypothetical protein
MNTLLIAAMLLLTDAGRPLYPYWCFQFSGSGFSGEICARTLADCNALRLATNHGARECRREMR